MNQSSPGPRLRARTPSGEVAAVAPADVAALDADLHGALFIPTDEGYDDARRLWNGAIDVKPAVIARCCNVADVVKAIEFAKQQRMIVSVRGGGHNVAGTALVENGLVLDLSPMREIEVDAEARVVRAQGGATLADIDAATHPYGLATPTGLVSRTGIAGLLLRGGLGHTMRRFGLTCDQLAAVNLVTSEGLAHHLTEDDDPELFWALRGGPLDFGVITDFELRLHPWDGEVRLVMAAYPVERGRELNQLLRDYVAHAPRELGLISIYMTLPDSEAVPKTERGRDVVLLYGMYTGARAAADEVLSPLLGRNDLVVDLGGWMPYPNAQQALDQDYPDGKRYYWKSLYLDELSDQVIEILDRFGRQRPSLESTLDVWVMGGAVRDLDPNRSVFPQRNANYMVAIEANWHRQADDEANIAWARRAFDALLPHSSGGMYLNFPGTRAEQQDAIQSGYGSVLDRLNRVQRRLDPVGLFASDR